ncbi:MAG: o-succinylbenzoate--CoA ligase [candidate division Zixibacteria bacterium]|nr:o-succinylbenzoate--CoA ligase [candidate division Zixibacteria bacterium]
MTSSEKIMPCPLSVAATKFCNETALIVSNKALNYKQYDQLVSRVANNLKKKNIQTGDRIAVVTELSPELPVIIMGIIRLGATACLLSPRLPARAILEYARDIDCMQIIAPGDTRFEKLSPISYEDILIIRLHLIRSDDVYIPYDTCALDREATVVWTSGSSARPKAVVHTYGNHYYSALGANKNMPFEPGDRWLLALPLYHVGGLSILFRAILGGGAVSIPEKEKSLAENIIENKITHLSLVATQLYRLLEDKKNIKKIGKTLKAVLLGGGPFPKKLIDKAVAYELSLYRSYGLTETASQVTTTGRADYPLKPDTSGRPLEYREIKISEENEILVRGVVLFKGYLESEGLSAPFDSDGWFHTGDIGHIDSDGCLTVTGRRDNRFISGGENIQPEEIENILCQRDDILEAMVVPVANDEFGYRPVAFVRIKDNSEPDKIKITEFLEKHLPRFKIPDYIYSWPENTDTGELKARRKFFTDEARRRSG